MPDSGYSGTPLAKKLGLKDGFRYHVVCPPTTYLSFFADFPSGAVQVSDPSSKKDFIHYFETEASQLEVHLIAFRKEIVENGMIWVSWPKKSSKMKSTVTEDIIRQIALRNGLVDVKVCAVDETWSGLKLVIRLKDRSGITSTTGKR